jgi:hypothetical protein
MYATASKRMSRLTNPFVVVLLATLSGCAVTRSQIHVSDPGASQPPTSELVPTSSARTVLIRSVTDERVFEDDSPDMSVPSLGNGGASKASAQIKARAIGRKKNGYGMALGDVLLDEDQTVAGLARDCVASGLRRAGYRVTSDPSEPGPNPLVVDVRIKKFWAWIQPGFWALTVHADIATELQFEGEAAPMVVNIPTQEAHPFVTDDVWMKSMTNALREYEAEIAVRVPAVDRGTQAAR